MTRTAWWLAMTVLTLGLASGSAAFGMCPAVPGDVDENDQATVGDVQCTILASLWFISGTGDAPSCLPATEGAGDVNCDASISVADVVLVISQVLEIPLDPTVDANANSCPDLCEAEGGFAITDVQLGTQAPELNSESWRVERARIQALPSMELSSPNYTLITNP